MLYIINAIYNKYIIHNYIINKNVNQKKYR